MEATHAPATASSPPATSSPAPNFAVVGTFLDALTAHDFAQLAPALDDDAILSALLPRGPVQWHGAPDICAQFERWFGDVDRYEVVDASVGQVGALLQLTWRLRVAGPRFGPDPMIVEQHVYASTGASGRVEQMSLLCSGFQRERSDV
jgi:hypothetical protein